jgi:hypothetical protein
VTYQLVARCLNQLRHRVPRIIVSINPLNAELNFICHLLALLDANRIFHVSRIRVKIEYRPHFLLKHRNYS